MKDAPSPEFIREEPTYTTLNVEECKCNNFQAF